MKHQNEKKIKLIFVYICFVTISLYGQSISQMELNYQKISQKFLKEQSTLDSLNTTHLKMISKIEIEKHKELLDENKIKEMLASAVVVSNQIKEQQIILDKIEIEIENLKTILERRYAVKIDSLKHLESSSSNIIDLEFLKAQKLKYIEKRLMIAPKIYLLSFDPKKLLQFKNNSEEDSLLKNIYLEYLNHALEEVNHQSHQLAFLIDEIEEVLSLHNEVYDFIEDVDSEIMFNPALQTSSTLEKNESVYLGGDPIRTDDEFSNIYSQANSYLHIFNQLKPTTNIDIQSPWKTPTDTIPANLTFQQYLELLENVDKMLQDYKTILEHKLESH